VRVMGVDPGLTRYGLSVVTGSRGGQIVALDVGSAHVENWLDDHPGVRAAR